MSKRIFRPFNYTPRITKAYSFIYDMFNLNYPNTQRHTSIQAERIFSLSNSHIATNPKNEILLISVGMTVTDLIQNVK